MMVLSMIEVETKLKIDNIGHIEERVKELIGEYKGEKTEIDIYFDHPDMQILSGGRAALFESGRQMGNIG
jgi:adenylate cyclase class IV